MAFLREVGIFVLCYSACLGGFLVWFWFCVCLYGGGGSGVSFVE